MYLANKNKSKKKNQEAYLKNSEKESLSEDNNLNNKKQILQSSILNIPNEQSTNTLKSLSNVELHGKLATAQLRVKANKIEQNMTEEERAKVIFLNSIKNFNHF